MQPPRSPHRDLLDPMPPATRRRPYAPPGLVPLGRLTDRTGGEGGGHIDGLFGGTGGFDVPDAPTAS